MTTHPIQLSEGTAIVFAGIPAVNNALYHQIRFSVGDPAALILMPGGKRFLILRDIEMGRAREGARVDQVACPADFTPGGGLSGDRETATSQAVAEFLVQNKITSVIGDRTMPLIFADEIQRRGINLSCDRDLGVMQRRQKDQQEIEWLREAQSVTERAVEYACRLIATATTDVEGNLIHNGDMLTSERVRGAVDVWLLERGYGGPKCIVAGGKEGSDCHNYGSGILKTEQPVIVDIFPQNRTTRYYGDCTRTVVHGAIPDEIRKMHAAVIEAKAAAETFCRAGVTGEAVHAETTKLIEQHGFPMGLPTADSPPDFVSMPHGTGHGIGLEVHEPPLLDKGGPELLVGDALTIEPGLYHLTLGGIRVEDMVIVTEGGCENLNTIHQGLTWD